MWYARPACVATAARSRQAPTRPIDVVSKKISKICFTVTSVDATNLYFGRFTPGTNPANWMLEVTAPGAENALGVDFARIYADSALAASNMALVAQACSMKTPTQQQEGGVSNSSLDRPFAASMFKQFRWGVYLCVEC